MRKIISLLLISLLSASTLLASCGDSESAESNFESSIPTEESKPWYATSTPEDYSNIYIDTSSESVDESYDSENSIPDNEQSIPDDEQSIPDNSQGGNGVMGYDDLDEFSGYSFVKTAKSYQIAYTKTSALDATECMTNVTIGITAIFDGTVTRFFDAVNGTYYYAVSGKYLYPCCENSFLAGDMNEFNGKYSITFTRISENGISFVMNDHAGHGIDYGYNSVYSATDKKVYSYDQELYGVKGATPCRYYESSVMSCFDGTDFNIDESALGKYGVASNEKVIIPFEYDLIITAQGDEDAGVYLAVKDGRCYYIASDGYILTPDGFDCGSQPFDDRAWVFEDGQGYIIKFN